MKKSVENWTIQSKQPLFELGLKDLFNYRYLIYSMVRRDITALYKQTILGPMWLLVQPVTTTFLFTFVFGSIAGLPSDGVPRPLFYLSGIITWNYFTECLNRTSTVFKDNAVLFGKVYFPRLTVPISIVISLLARLSIQLVLLCVYIFIYYLHGYHLHFFGAILLIPVVILLAALQGMGIGLTISALTIKYRDLSILLGFALQLLMYATPIIYPLSAAPDHIKWLISSNPMTAVIETFRFALFGTGNLDWPMFLQSALTSVLLLITGLFAFQRAEKNFIDHI
ncbi:MAG: ABC transporter permease [Bacteroidota bacterium]